MKYSGFRTIVILFFAVLVFPSGIYSQSRDQNFPTPATSSEIAGVIPARDVGDARLTSYFYTFDGLQGDIFINVVTKNLTGDIDVFTAGSIQPLTKIIVYADSVQNETGRVIYLRRPARLLLRVEGRSPNDDPATFKIKFAGSFAAMAAGEKDAAPIVDRSERSDTAGIQVNSVGTIIETPPRSKETLTAADVKKDEAEIEPDSGLKADKIAADEKKSVETPTVRITPAPDVKTVIGGRPSRTKAASRRDPAPGADPVKSSASGETNREGRSTPEPKADPLASINLMILMKDGGLVQHPMNEVLRFSVDKGVLTVITKDRKTSRFSILNVERVTIQ